MARYIDALQLTIGDAVSPLWTGVILVAAQPAARAAAMTETPTLRARCGRSARGGHSEDNLAYPNPYQFDILQSGPGWLAGTECNLIS